MSPLSPNICPECGKPVPADSQHQICPACLMAQALASRTIGVNPAAAVPPLTPEEIAGKFPQFEILECLGRGGMGVVYKARQKSLNRLVAIKVLAPEREREARFAERFAREAELLAQLGHPHIVTIHDFGETGGLFYLVMEFVDGVNLRDLLREGKLAPKQALAIVPPICEALQYAHDKGIVHCDIKPENLLLDRDGRLKIADFGIATLVGATGGAAGTPPYMAPEQAGNSAEVDHRADIYALGVVLYEMLTGERPRTDFVAPSKRVQLDVRIDEIVLRALEKSPELRYQTANEFRSVVETIAGAASAGANPVVLPAQPGGAGNPTKQVLRWMLFNERTGRRNFNWPFLLFYCSQIGLVVNGTILAITLVLWLLNVTLPYGKSFASPGEVWRMILWIVACVVMRQVALTALTALNLDYKTVGWSRLFQQTWNFKGLMVFLTSAVLTGGLAFLFPWMHAIFKTVFAGVNSLTNTNTARVAVWIAISAALGLFILRRFWRPGKKFADPSADATCESPPYLRP